MTGSESFLQAGRRDPALSQVKDVNLLQGKKVAVVGFAKSATDMSLTTAADKAAGCIINIVSQGAMESAANYFGNKGICVFCFFRDCREAFFNAPRKSFGQNHCIPSAGRWYGREWCVDWKLLLEMQFRLKACGMVPKHRIEDQISCSLGVALEGFYEKVRSRQIDAKQTTIASIEGKNVLLSNGDTIQPDLIIFGTGFSQELAIPGTCVQAVHHRAEWSLPV